MNSLKEALITQEGFTPADADVEIAYMRAKTKQGHNPEDILYGVGLGPDYIHDLV